MGWRDAPEVTPPAAGGWRNAPEIEAPAPEAAPAPARGPQTSAWDALAAGAGQGALSAGDELGAGFQALLAGAMGSDIYGVADTYRKARGENRQIRDASWEQHPYAYAGGYVPGMVGSLAVPIGQAASAASKGKTLWQLARQSGKLGGAQGALSAIGGSEADLTRGDIGGFLGDIAMGYGTGGVLGAGLAPVAKLAEYVAPKMGGFAYRRAVKAAGPMLKDVRALQRGGRLEAVGKKLMDMGLIPGGAGVATIAEGVEGAANKAGGDVGAALHELDSLLPAAESSSAPAGLRRTLTPAELSTPNGLTRLPPALESREFGDFPGHLDLRAASGTVNQRVPGLAGLQQQVPDLPGFNPARVGARLRSEVLGPLADQPALQSLLPDAERHIANLEALGDRRLAFARANDIKGGYDKLLNWDKQQTPAKEVLKQIRGIVNEEIENSAEAAATAAGHDGLAERFRTAKGDYRDLRQVADFARDKVAREEANRFASPSDYGTGIASFLAAVAAGHPALGAIGGLAMTGAHKLARERGSSVAAHGALSLSKLLANPGQPGSGFAGRALTSLPGRRTQDLRTLLDLLAPAILGRTAPGSADGAALQELSR